MITDLILTGGKEGLWQTIQKISGSALVPSSLRNKPGDIVIAMDLAERLGFSPLSGLQSIAVINGRPCVWGDMLLALVLKHPDFAGIKDEFDKDEMRWTFTVRRKSGDYVSEITRSFSKKDADKAGLWGKTGPWKSYPDRMIMHRARSWAIRDLFSDVLAGASVAEEMQGIQEEGPLQTVADYSTVPPAPPMPAPEDNIEAEREVSTVQEVKDEAKKKPKKQPEKIEDIPGMMKGSDLPDPALKIQTPDEEIPFDESPTEGHPDEDMELF